MNRSGATGLATSICHQLPGPISSQPSGPSEMHNQHTPMKRAFILLAALVCLSFRTRAAILPAEKLLPDDTLVFFSIPDFARASETLKHSPQGRLWQDPSLKPFKDKFLNKLKDLYVTPLEQQTGIHFDDYASLPQGQFTLAVTQNGWTGQDFSGPLPAILLLVDTKDKSSQLKTSLADLKKKWVDAGKTVRTEKIRDVEFSIISVSSNDLPKALRKSAGAPPSDAPDSADKSDAAKVAPKNDIYIGQTDSLLIIGNSAKAIGKILARLSGDDIKTVADLPSFAADSAIFRDAFFFAWVNAKSLVDLFAHTQDGGADSDSSTGSADFKPGKIVAALGVDGLKDLALSYKYSDEGALGTLSLGVPEAGRSGIFKILAGEPKECAPPAFVPLDVMKFQRWRIDGQQAWATLQTILNGINPQATGFIGYALSTAESAAKEKDPDFDIKKNLFGNLGDDMISYSKSPKADATADLAPPSSLFLLGSPNPEQLAAALKSLLPLLPQSSAPPTERDFLGHKICTIPLPSTPASKSGADANSLSYCCSGGYIAFASDATMIEDYLRNTQNEGKSLRDTAGLNDATQKVAGPGASVFGYSNDAETMRATLLRLKKIFGADDSGGVNQLALALGANADKFKEWFDFSLLPDVDQLSKYFSFTVYAETATPDGLVFRGFTPVPPQLKAAGN